MQRPIIDYYLDEEGDWVALLSCQHGQHVRHDPPFVNRPWVVTQDGRDSMLGSKLNCVRCDRFELPDQLNLIQRTENCSADNMPSELCAGMATKPGIWTRIVVQEGKVACQLGVPLSRRLICSPLEEGVVPPEVLYSISSGPAIFYLEYYGPFAAEECATQADEGIKV